MHIKYKKGLFIMYFFSLLIASLVIFFGILPEAYAAKSCKIYGNAQKNYPQYYYGNRSCHRLSCLKKIRSKSRPINAPAGSYQFLYIPAKLRGLKNSIVISQVVKKGAGYDDNLVRVSRNRIEFSCEGNLNGRRTRHKVRLKYSATVNYKKFDQWHRYGHPTKGEPFVAFISSLHTRFDNGVSCVATSDEGRRVRFLFDRRNDIPWRIGKVLNALFGKSSVGQAHAATRNKPARKLRLLNYRTDLSTEPCVSFAFSHESSTKTIINIDDLENTKPVYPDYNNGTIRSFKFITTQ
jgi:hypothetical protein